MAEQKSAAEGATAVLGGMGGRGGRRGKTPVEMSNCERVVDLMQAAFGEWRIAE